ncbi:MAG: hypothetical protein OIF35_02555, partial [Cellvibrionaceae bacterium]|nr:hypothetical protein [Cellvibrionaceae bacterium]
MTRAIALVSLALASLAAKAEPIPIEAWSHDPYIEQVQLSPSGKRMLAITLTGVNQPPEVSVWDTTDLSKAPVRMKPKRSKVIGAYWLSDDKLLIIGRQKFDIRAGGKPTRTFRSPVYAANADGSGKIKELFRTRNNIRGANVVNMLRDQPNKVLMELFMIDGTTEFVELNTKTMIGKKIFRGGDSSSYNTDSLGQVKIRQQLKTDSK